MKRILLAILLAVTTLTGSFARTTASTVFASAPRGIFPLLDQTTRLDMIDYYNGGVESKSENTLGGGASINDMTDQSLTVKLTDASSCQLFLLEMGGDTIVGLINTVKDPAPDSRIEFYTTEWETFGSNIFNRPELQDWVKNKKNLSEVQALVPFLLVSYEYIPSDNKLIMTNNTRQFLTDDVYSIVAPYIYDSKVMVWNGKQFSDK